MMDINALKDMIKRHEGYKNYVYLCQKGHKTIGWGFNLDVHGLPKDIQVYLDANGFITPSHAERLLDASINEAISGCLDLFPDFNKFSENRQLALCDFVFNVGKGKAAKFVKAIHAINMGDWETASDEMMDSLWFKQVGARSLEICDMVEKG